MNIRPERPEDYAEIAALLDATFNGTYESGLVARVRQSDAYMPSLTLVGEEGGRIVAFVMLSLVGIETCSYRDVAVAVGPLAVLPDKQKGGRGTAIMHEALGLLDVERAGELTVLLGHWEYYPRFGFVPASSVGVYPPLPWSELSFMARTWIGCRKKGMIRYPEAWQIAEDFSNERIRRAEPEDMVHVARVFAIAFRHGMPFVPNLHTAAEDVAFFGGKVFVENEVWVAEDGAGQIFGFIAFANDFVNHLYVLPLAQGCGVGWRLLQVAMDKHDSLQLWTFQKNERARAFYKRCGFEELKLTNGEANEENEPDVLLGWTKCSKPQN